MPRHFCNGELRRTSVVELRLLTNVNTVHLASNGLEHCSAAGTGRAENDEHLPRVEDTIDRVENLDLALAVSDKVAELSKQVGGQVANGLLVVYFMSAEFDVIMVAIKNLPLHDPWCCNATTEKESKTYLRLIQNHGR